MWAAIAIIVLALVMVLLAPKPKIEHARAANLGDFNFPRSKEGDPVPWLRGTVRLRSPNSLWWGDYTPVPIKKKQKTGLFSSKQVTVGYKYHIGLDLCWCLGGNAPVELLRLWADKHLFWEGLVSTAQSINIAAGNLFGGSEQRGGLSGFIDYYPGRFDEERNAYLVSKADPDVPAYIGQCRMVFRGNLYTPPRAFGAPRLADPESSGYTSASGFYFGTTTNIAPISAELRCLSADVHPDYSVMPNGLDVNPMELLYAGFTQKFGMPGVDTTAIDMESWQRDAEILFNEGLGMSLLVQQSITGKDLCEEVLRLADGILYQDDSTGKMVSKLIRYDYDVADLPVIDMSIIKELVNFSKTTWEQTYNQCRVVFKDRDNEYAEKVATAQDFANINFQNRVRNVDISVPGCYVNEVGNVLATRQLTLLSVPLFQIELRCNRRASTYKPGDAFIFNYAPYGISMMIMRVKKVNKGTLTDGVVTIEAVQDRFATAKTVFAPPGSGGWVNPVGNPVPMVPEGLFELPFEISGTQGAIVAAMGVRMQGADMGYRIVWGETAGDENLVNRTDSPGFTPAGTLATAYPADTAAFDDEGFMLANVKQSEEVFDASEDELWSGASVALVRSSAGDELVAWQFFDGAQVAGVVRGIFGTVPLTHPAGAHVFFLSYGYGLLNEDAPYTETPRPVYAKLLPYNARGDLPMASAVERTATAVNKAQRPAVPGRVRVNGVGPHGLGTVVGQFTLAWAHRSRLDVQVRTQDDPSVDIGLIEPGTGYNVRVYDNVTDALLVEALNGDASAAFITIDTAAELRVELTATRGGLESYTAQAIVFNYAPGAATEKAIAFDETTVVFDGGRV